MKERTCTSSILVGLLLLAHGPLALNDLLGPQVAHLSCMNLPAMSSGSISLDVCRSGINNLIGIHD